MAKYVLVGIAAQYIHTNLAVRALASFLGDDHPYDITIRDFTINQSVEHIYSELVREKAEVILISCYIWNRAHCDALTKRLKAASPEMALYLGGPEASWQAYRLLDEQVALAGVFTGEGEVPLQTFLQQWERDEPDFHQVPGLAWRDHHGDITINPPGPLLNMSVLPLPYTEQMQETKNRIVYYESSRGCPYRCAYCLSSLDRQVRVRPLPQVFSDLAIFLAAKVKQVKFIDRTFNADAERALAIWQYIGENDNGVTNFHFEVTADIVSDKALPFLATLRPGLLQFEIGVQSTHLPTLAAVHRHMELNRLATVVKHLKKEENIHLHLDLIAGLPYEGLSEFRTSFDEVYQIQPHVLQLGFLKVLPGTELHDKAEDYGLRYDPQAPYEILATPHLSVLELCQLKDVEAVLNVYHNSGRFEYALGYLMSLQKSSFDVFASIADAWRELGFYGIHTGVIQQCEALRQAGKTLPNYREEIFQCALAFDLYRREKPRRWPTWLKDFSLSEREAREHLARPNAEAVLASVGATSEKTVIRQNLFAVLPPEAEETGLVPGCWFFKYDQRDLNGNAVAVHLD